MWIRHVYNFYYISVVPTQAVYDMDIFSGMDFWVALQLRTARASGWRDDLTAHLEASRFCYPTDVIDSQAGCDDVKRMQVEHEVRITLLVSKLVLRTFIQMKFSIIAVFR